MAGEVTMSQPGLKILHCTRCCDHQLHKRVHWRGWATRINPLGCGHCWALPIDAALEELFRMYGIACPWGEVEVDRDAVAAMAEGTF